MIKYTIEEIKLIFKKRGCTLLEKEYINTRSKLKYKCHCNKVSYITLTSFTRERESNYCMYCTPNRKLNYKEVRSIFKKQGCKLLSREYINSATPLKYKCSCGNISTIRLGDFNRGLRCMKCGTEKASAKQKLSYKYVKNFFKKKGCKLLSKTYENNRGLLRYKCSCNNISTICFDSFKAGHKCMICGIKKQSTNQLGSLNHMWNSTYSEEDRKNEGHLRLPTPEYNKWREKVLKRDNYSCVCCEISRDELESGLHVHHIIPYLDNVKLRLKVSNGATLCRDCPTWFHKYYGTTGINKSHLKEFIYNSNCGHSKNIKQKCYSMRG